MTKDWSVYLLECADKTIYTGITNNIEKRLIAHNQGKTGAKYTKGRRPVRLVYKETDLNKSEALKREDVLRKQPRSVKLDLIKKIDR
jgi:putative endonuclease